MAEVTTDAAGRAALELVIPEDLESSPHLMLEAISPRGVRRVFEVTLELEPRYGLELYLDRTHVPERARVLAVGRVIDRAGGVAVAGHEGPVEVELDRVARLELERHLEDAAHAARRGRLEHQVRRGLEVLGDHELERGAPRRVGRHLGHRRAGRVRRGRADHRAR